MTENTPSEKLPPRIRRTSRAAQSGLDILLSEAGSGGSSQFIAPGAGVKVGAGLVRHPRRVAARAAGLAGQLGRVVSGRSELAPAKGDRRFADRAWDENWLLRRLLQAYLAVGEGVDGLISDAEAEWRAERRARLAAANVLDALAPTNFAFSNPAVIKETVDTGGSNLVRGTRRLVRDLSNSPRLPGTGHTKKFEGGRNPRPLPRAG